MSRGLAGRDCTGGMTDGALCPSPALLTPFFPPRGGASQATAETQRERLLLALLGADPASAPSRPAQLHFPGPQMASLPHGA